MRAYQRHCKSYVAMEQDGKTEIGRYTTVDGLRQAMKRRGLERGQYRVFQIKYR